jgi:hypothetical protein
MTFARGVTEKSVKTLEPIGADWRLAFPERSRELDQLLDRQLTFSEKLEWLEEAETLSLHLRANRDRMTTIANAARSEWSVAGGVLNVHESPVNMQP